MPAWSNVQQKYTMGRLTILPLHLPRLYQLKHMLSGLKNLFGTFFSQVDVILASFDWQPTFMFKNTLMFPGTMKGHVFNV